MTASFYRAEGDLLYPQQAATGSWNKAHQNGVAIGGALVRAAETLPTMAPMTVCRVTIDIMKAVPFQPVRVEAKTLRDGRRLQLVQSTLYADEDALATATVLRARLGDSDASPPPALAYPSPEDTPVRPVTSVLSTGHPMETRMVEGSAREPGPGSWWTTFNAALVAGEEMSPFVRAVMTADIAGAPSSELDSKLWTYANVDLSVYFMRAPEGDWVFGSSQTLADGQGTGLVNSVLADRRGVFGRAHQTLFVAPR